MRIGALSIETFPEGLEPSTFGSGGNSTIMPKALKNQ
jgi:hypothetical protein